MPADARGRLLLAAPVLLVALLLAWAALREAVVRGLPPSLPAARAIADDDPRTKAAAFAAQSLATVTRPIAPGERRQVAMLLRQLPLADEPFVAEGRGAWADGDLARSIRLLEEARRRSPRNRVARLLLLDRYARANRFDDAVAEAATLRRLLPDATDVLVGVMVQLTADPRGFGPVRRVLADDPVLANAVLARMAVTGADPVTVLVMARDLQTRVVAGQPDWHGSLTTALADAGRYAEARRLWRRFNRVSPSADGVFDPLLKGLRATPPFAWTSLEEGAGAVDWRRRGGVDIAYYGRASGTLMTQSLTLAPGRHVLTHAFEGSVNPNGSGLAWRVRCVGPAGRTDQALAEASIGRTARSVAFAVPAGCPAQQLTLDGTATEFPQETDITIRRISVVPAGGPR